VKQLRGAEVLRPSVPDYQRLQEAFKEQMLKTFLGRRTEAEALRAAAQTWTKILREQAQ
jgi:maltose-binding protein MalE